MHRRIVSAGGEGASCDMTASSASAAPGRHADRIGRRLAFGMLALLLALPSHAHARYRLSGDVQRVKMIGFTVADVGRQADFFTKVLQFEKISDFRVVGGEYDKMQGVFNANMRIIHLKLGEQIVELTQYISPPTGRPIPVPSTVTTPGFSTWPSSSTTWTPPTRSCRTTMSDRFQRTRSRSRSPIPGPRELQGDQVPRPGRS